MSTHTGLDHVRAEWDAVGQTRTERAVAFVPEGSSFFETGAQAAGRFLQALPADLVGAGPLTILDLGAGLGRVSAALVRAGHRVLAVDIAPAMIAALVALRAELANAGAPGSLTPLLSDGTNLHTLGFQPAIDVVYSDGVLLHNLKADVRRILRSCAGAVRPGGALVFQLPCYAEGGREPEHYTDVGVWTPQELAEAAGAAGLLVDRLAVSPGTFSFQAVGPAHGDLHVLRDPRADQFAKRAQAKAIEGLQASARSLLEDNSRLRAEIAVLQAERADARGGVPL